MLSRFSSNFLLRSVVMKRHAATLVCLLLVGGNGRPAAAGTRRWQVLQTNNFRVLHLNATTARKFSRRLERLRAAQFQLWGATRTPRPWRPRCVIYLYPTNRDLVRMTGGGSKAGSAQSRPSRLRPGTMLHRRINLAADDRNLMDSTLPHEVTHVVVGDLLGGKAPRWANEGMAVLAEQMSRIQYYDQVLNRALKAGGWFPIKRLMLMRRYPSRPHLALYYAQSTSLVLYFVSRKDNATFIRFLRQAQRGRYLPALRRFYGVRSYLDLQRRWHTAARE